MRKRKGFTLIELLVVIAIIALLMGILMPALSRVKQQAKDVACKGRLKQWTLIFAMYTNDNNGYFHTRTFGSQEGYDRLWYVLYQPLYKDPMMLCCPAAQNPNQSFGPFGTWGWDGPTDQDWGWGGSWIPENGLYGSYAFSRYMLHNKGNEYWGQTGVKGADNIPVFLDCQYVAIQPSSKDTPPEYDGGRKSGNEMQFSCMGRHVDHINVLFLDWTVRSVDLKELWTLKWSPTFDTAGPWTKAGNATSSDWPVWMRNFKDY